MDANALSECVEPQQKWLMNASQDTTQKHGDAPKLIDMSPSRGNEGTIITVVVQALPSQMPVKLAFNSLVVDTKQMQAQGITSLVATVPPFQQTHSASPAVPISICFLDKDMVTETWLVAEFMYMLNDAMKYERKRSISFSMDDYTAKRPERDSFSGSYQNYYQSSPAQPQADPSCAYGFNQMSPYSYSYPRADFSTAQQSPQQISQHRPSLQSSGRSAVGSASSVTVPNASMNLYGANQGFTNMLTGGLEQNTMMPSPLQSSPSSMYGYKSNAHTPTTPVANYQPYPGLVSRANLNIIGDLDAMTKSWAQEEWDNRRRLVQFWREQTGNKISCSFTAVPQGERATKSGNIVVSCIYWMERNDFFITSVDCIYLLECLMDIRFSVEEKNRIRRNLEGFRPLTVSKCKADSSEFFKLIMGFPNPKPRNIEKDVKVFPWKTLPYALKKIVTKYTASSYNPSSTSSASAMTKPRVPKPEHYYQTPMQAPNSRQQPQPPQQPQPSFYSPSSQYGMPAPTSNPLSGKSPHMTGAQSNPSYSPSSFGNYGMVNVPTTTVPSASDPMNQPGLAPHMSPHQSSPQQQHSAREYHRKMGEQVLANLNNQGVQN
ncbi:uncharacterized protein BYT42DRAFT_615554 [Radiomyces spectabilis]|uniref:uncharacterized protein n=1 Tax=Radiomyces spectabilis TaxID=64574 RepID=UPI00221F4586|nr:uncharacterized protein BYT42DRAFT_615554 [Radiomyces spectabilis]KAI8374384.1 hypothetical protein BYT42DRAFT_615554 [Radiomyces spectabilis]